MRVAKKNKIPPSRKLAALNLLKRLKSFRLPALLIFILVILTLLTFQVVFADKYFPRVFIGDTHLMLLTKQGANRILSSKYSERQGLVNLTYQDKQFTIDLSATNVRLSSALDQAFTAGHLGSWDKKLTDQMNLLMFGSVVTPEVDLPINSQISEINKAVAQNPEDATFIIEDQASSSAQIKIIDGKVGQAVDEDSLKSSLVKYLVFGQSFDTLPVKTVEPNLTTQEAQKAKAVLEAVAKDPIKLTYEGGTWTIDAKTLMTLLDLSQNEGSIIDRNKLNNYLKDLSKNIDQPVVEALFKFETASSRVSAFKPAQDGRELDIDKTATLITLALDNQRAKTISLPVNVTKPKIQNADVNSMGIKELVGRGVSNFAGSIENRIYNLSLAASRIDGVLIPPGQEFSFNNTVGDISGASGYKPAYVIKSGRTVLDDGGGVCQVSTTVFRAALNAGLPVTARTAHAYRVGYYEQGFPPGLDATVFSPSVDFKFKNDTPTHLLLQAYTDGVTLYVDLYGTSDGRTTTLTKPVILSQTPALPELRQDDPNLPKGQIKQVDWPAVGANVSFSRTVTKAGQTLIQETFRSNYRPWQAIFLVGTKEG